MYLLGEFILVTSISYAELFLRHVKLSFTVVKPLFNAIEPIGL